MQWPHTGFMRYFKNMSWLFFEKALRILVGLFVGAWVARYLGSEQFGLFSYAQSFAGICAVFATLGLESIVVRELVKDENRTDQLIGTAFWMKLAGAFLVLLILTVAINFTSNNTYTTILVFIIASATIFQSFNVVYFYFRAKVLSKYAVYNNVVVLLLSSIIKIILILNEAPLIYFAWVVLFDSLVLALGFIYFYTKKSSSIKHWQFDKVVAIELLKNSWPLLFSGVAITVYLKIDQVMIQSILGSAAVGQYAAAVRLSEALFFVPGIIAGSLLPAIINTKKQSETLYNQRVQKLCSLVAWLAIIVALLITFLGDWLVNLLYGVEYYQAASVLIIHIWSGIFAALLASSGQWFIVENLTHLALYRNISGAVVNIALNIALIPHHGIQGAAVATLISYAVAAYFFDYFHIKTRKIFWMKTKIIIRPLLIFLIISI